MTEIIIFMKSVHTLSIFVIHLNSIPIVHQYKHQSSLYSWVCYDIKYWQVYIPAHDVLQKLCN